MTERNERNECWSCKYKREVPGSYHIRCANPDPQMKGNPHGIKKGWFFYWFNFDPVWKTKLCNNYKEL